MEQIAERRAQISQYIQPYMEECFQKSCNIIQAKLENHAGIMQERQLKGKMQYLVFSFLRCGIHLERLELRIDFLDDGFYLDEQETAASYYPDFLQGNYAEDINFLQKKAGGFD